jgi:hypothetical protein
MKTLIYGGHVIDPANRVNGKLNILVDGDKIAWVGTSMKEADRLIDATGKIVTPGFIDIHMHEDPVVDGKIESCIFDMMLRMGVTTAVGGNDATTTAPSETLPTEGETLPTDAQPTQPSQGGEDSGEDVTPDADVDTDVQQKDEGGFPWLIVGIAGGAVLLIAAGVAVFLILRKKKQ